MVIFGWVIKILESIFLSGICLKVLLWGISVEKIGFGEILLIFRYEFWQEFMLSVGGSVEGKIVRGGSIVFEMKVFRRGWMHVSEN